MLCKSCGNPIPDGVMFCPECGFSVQEQHNSESQGSRKLIESDTSSTLSSPSQSYCENVSSGKKVRKKFKDLSPKQKALRFGIGGILIVIALILFVSDGFFGAKKTGKVSRKVDVVPYECDTGAVFDLELSDFCNSFSKSLKNYYDTDFNLYDILGTPTSGVEESGVSYQLYQAKPFTDVFIFVKVIDSNVAGIIVSSDYASESYKENLGAVGEIYGHSVLALGHINTDEEENIRKELGDACDKSKTRTSYIDDDIKYTIIPDKLNNTVVGFTLTIDPVSEDYVESLSDNIIQIDESDAEENNKAIEETEEEMENVPGISEDQAIAALYATSAFKGNSAYEINIQYGYMDDVSVGEVLDFMFENPDISYEYGTDCIYVTVSGMYWVDGSSRSSGNVTYRIDENLNVNLDTAKSKYDMEQKILEWASYLANT